MALKNNDRPPKGVFQCHVKIPLSPTARRHTSFLFTKRGEFDQGINED